MKTAPTIGSRVRFSKAWLQSTGTYTGPVPQLRGTVAAVRTFSSCPAMVAVDWDVRYFDGKITNVLATNLEACR
jgi:hypothetical protein